MTDMQANQMDPPPSVLLVDDEADFVSVMANRLANRNFIVKTAHDGMAALSAVRGDPEIEVVVLDLRMPGMDGLDVLERIRETNPLVEVILLTGHGAVESAVEGMKRGAMDYLTKPCELRELTTKILEGAANRRRFESQILAVRSSPPSMRKTMIASCEDRVKAFFEGLKA